MHSNRRTFLHSLTAAGLAISGVHGAQASIASAPAAPHSSEVLAITSALPGSALDAAFVTGVQRTAQHVHHNSLNNLDSASFQRLNTLLSDGQDTVLIGLLDDASATLVLDLVRSAGGRVLSVEHHRVAHSATDWAQHLGHALASGQPLNTDSAHAGHEARVSFRCLI